MKTIKLISTAILSLVWISTTFATGGLKVSGTKKDITCFGQKNGRIELSVAGGTAPYTYAWNNGSTESLIDNLAKGSYTVVVTDAQGVSVSQTYEVIMPKAMTVMFNQNDRMPVVGLNAEANVMVAGGTPFKAEKAETYNVSFNTSSNATQMNPTVDGSYLMTVKDANGCTLQMKPTVRIHDNGQITEVKSASGFGEVDLFMNQLTVEQAVQKLPENTMN